MKTRTMRIAVAATACSAAAANSALAFPLLYRISGRVSAVDAPLTSRFSVGDALTGQVVIETTPTNRFPQFSNYDASGFSATIGTTYTLTSDLGLLSIVDNALPTLDDVLLHFAAPHNLVGPTVNGHFPDYFTVNLQYDSNTLSSTDLLPRFPTSNFASIQNDLSSLRFDVDDSIEVHLTITDFSAVPEPMGAAWLAMILASRLPRRRQCGSARGRPFNVGSLSPQMPRRLPETSRHLP